MEAPRNERNSGSDNDFHSLYKDLKDLSDLSLENNTVEEMSKDVKTSDDKKEEYKEVSSDVEVQRLFEPENMTNMCTNRESTNSNETLQLDVMVISRPQMNRRPNQDEQSETANTNQATSRSDKKTNVMWNTKALPKEARTYELEKFEKNCLIIFNHENFDHATRRIGTDKDVKALTETFTKFGFEVVEHKDFTKDKIIEVLETFKTTNFSEYGCVEVVVLTHGSGNGILWAKDQEYSEKEILKYLREQPTLVTKPKLLMIQACRDIIKVPPGESAQPLEHLMKEVECYSLPNTSDMLIVHSSYIGEVSFRDEIHGTWFIQTICSKINEMSPTHDLESILTEVKREVAVEKQCDMYNKSTGKKAIYKQMPTVISTLIRRLYLRKFGDDSRLVTLLDTAMPSTSAGSVLVTAGTPSLYQLGACSRFLEQFDYMKRCLTFFLEENPNDATARKLLDTSNAFGNEHQFNDEKKTMAKAICEFLNQNARHCEFFKYVYLPLEY